MQTPEVPQRRGTELPTRREREGVRRRLGTGQTARSRKRRQGVIAVIAAAAMVFLGVSPAFAEVGAADGAQVETSTSQTMSSQMTESAPAPVPAPGSEPAPEPEPSSAPESTSESRPAPASEPARAPESAPAPSAEPPAAASSAAIDEAGSTSEAAEDVPERPEPPYLRWVVTDSDGAVQPGVTLRVQGPRDHAVQDDGEDSQWAHALTATVKDNTGQNGYVGADVDPRPGHFLLTSLTDDADAERTHDVAGDDTARVQPTQVPDGFTTDAEKWQDIAATASDDQNIEEVVLETSTESEQAFAPMAIDPGQRPPGGAIINVNLNTLRSGSTAATAGIQFRLHANTTTGNYSTYGAAVSGAWATCTTDADGDCTFYVPASGTGTNVQYWVVPLATPGAGSFISEYLVTGNNTDSGSSRFAVTPYAIRTPAISASTTVRHIPGTGTANMPSSSRVGNPTLPLTLTTATSDRWAHIPNDMIATLSNNRYEPQCDVPPKVALIVDLSTSMVSPNDTGLVGAKAASRAFASAFADTGVQLGIYSFGTNANATVRTPQPITGGNLSGVHATINGMSVSGTQYTNWDRGIEQIEGDNFDFAVVLTDGNPTRYRNGNGNQSWTDMRGIEEAVLSANLVKSQGTQILAFGVGAFLNSSMPQNLEAVTGQIAWGSGTSIINADYAITNQWSTVATELSNLASALTCEATVQVHKQERALDGSLSNGQGWTFTPSKSGQGTLMPTGSQVTNSNGVLPNPWEISFTDKDHTADLQIAETQKPGYAFESVTCRNHGSPMQGVANAATFTLSGLGSGDAVVCTVINMALPPPVNLKVTKTWVVNGQTYANGAQPDDAGTAALSLSPPPSGVTNPQFGTSYTYTVGAGVEIDETYTPGSDGCRLDSSRVTSVNGQSASHNLADGAYAHTMTASPDPNKVTITNTVTCDAKLTLVKVFDISYGAPADTDEWTLIANGETTPISGKTGDDEVTDRTVTPGPYTLTEAGPGGYIPSSWVCVDGDTTLDMNGGTVTVPIGGKVTCTITNADKPGAVKWTKVAAGSDHLLEGSEWKIVGPDPATTETAIIDCVEDSAPDCTGADKDPAAGKFLLEGLHWGTYTVTETKAPPGYVADASFTFTVTNGTVIDEGAQANEQQAPVDLPLTGGLSTDLFTGWGIGITAFAALLAAGYWWNRNRRQAGSHDEQIPR